MEGVIAGGERYFTKLEAVADDFRKTSGGVLKIDFVIIKLLKEVICIALHEKKINFHSRQWTKLRLLKNPECEISFPSHELLRLPTPKSRATPPGREDISF
jgi:hypothetical protein